MVILPQTPGEYIDPSTKPIDPSLSSDSDAKAPISLEGRALFIIEERDFQTVRDSSNINLATDIFDAFAQLMSTKPDKLIDALKPIGPISRYGPALKLSSLDPQVSIFSANFTFNGSIDGCKDLVTAISSVDLADPNACSQFLSQIGWNFCQAFQGIAPSSTLHQLDAYQYTNSEPIKAFPILSFVNIASFAISIFTGLGKAKDQKFRTYEG